MIAKKTYISLSEEYHLVGFYVFLEIECLMEEDSPEDFVEDGAVLSLTTKAVSL